MGLAFGLFTYYLAQKQTHFAAPDVHPLPEGCCKPGQSDQSGITLCSYGESAAGRSTELVWCPEACSRTRVSALRCTSIFSVAALVSAEWSTECTAAACNDCLYARVYKSLRTDTHDSPWRDEVSRTVEWVAADDMSVSRLGMITGFVCGSDIIERPYRQAFQWHQLPTTNPKSTTTVFTVPKVEPIPAKNLGAVYTPKFLAKWVATQLMEALPPDEPALVIDPALGDGQLLNAVGEVAGDRVELLGIDINPVAVSQARRRLPTGARTLNADALRLTRNNDAATSWRALIGVGRPVGVIANPPWGADLDHSPAELASLGYTLANGQFDSYDLFVELCISFAPEGSVLAFILPDSLFGPEHEPLRHLIVRSTEIISISRLGEGFFPGVYRGTVVLVLRTGTPKPTHEISCFRLNKEWRRRVLSGTSTLADAQSHCSHCVKQNRFAKDPQARFDIDVQQSEESTLTTIGSSPLSWTRWLQSGRGIELSKTGRIVTCRYCNNAHPLPRDNERFVTCSACGRRLAASELAATTIIRPLQAPEPGWHPLIVGEDVDRYRCIPSRQIKTDITGINYKTPETFQQRKLLIRKTGIGIKAAIDESGAYTNQVVFHYFVPSHVWAPPFLLDYLQGVLSSRVLLAYYLKRIGENEWRSHPYVTQKTISTLPIPEISEGTWQWRQAQAIAEEVTRRRSRDSHSSAEDIMIDCLVAGLYGLDQRQCHWVVDVLDQAESLEPIRTVRLPNKNSLQPLRPL